MLLHLSFFLRVLHLSSWYKKILNFATAFVWYACCNSSLVCTPSYTTKEKRIFQTKCIHTCQGRGHLVFKGIHWIPIILKSKSDIYNHICMCMEKNRKWHLAHLISNCGPNSSKIGPLTRLDLSPTLIFPLWYVDHLVRLLFICWTKFQIMNYRYSIMCC